MNHSAAQVFETEINEVACPLCLHSKITRLATFEERSLWKCDGCDLRFVFPQPSPSTFSAHFRDDDVSGVPEQSIRFEKNRDNVLARVAEYIQRRKKSGDILDVGCATGYFLNRFFPKKNWRAWGVELSRDFAQRASEQGITVYCGDVSQMPSEHSFDVITILDAFYYFRDPHSTLRHLHDQLKPGGLLILELPVAGSRIWRGTSTAGRLLSGTRHSLLQLSDHLFYYGPKPIRLLLEQCGYEIQSIEPLPGNWHPRFLRRNFNRAFSCLSSGLNVLSRSRIFLGPRFLVAAVRK